MICQIIVIVIKWKFSKRDCYQIAQDISTYVECNLTVSQHEMSPSTFWHCTIKYSKATRTLVGYIFSLKGHAAPVETIFSSLSYSKPKIRNKMTSTNLKIIATVQKSLKRGEPTKSSGKRTHDATTGVNPNVDDNSDELLFTFIWQDDNVEEFDFEEAFEEVISEDNDFGDLLDVESVELVLSSSNNFIDGLFDMNKFNAAGVHVNASNPTHNIQNEENDEEFFTVDDILVL